MKAVLGVEIGTKSAKAIIIRDRRVIAIASSRGYKPEQPAPGVSRQNPDVWWNAFLDVLVKVCRKAKIGTCNIGFIAIGGQCMVWCPTVQRRRISGMTVARRNIARRFRRERTRWV